MKPLICPLTGVYIPRFLLAVLGGVVFVAIFDFVVHSILLMGLYGETAALWRPEEEMIMSWMIGRDILMVIISLLIFTRHYEAKGMMEGMRFGLMLGALLAVLMSAAYAWMPISLSLALSWAGSGLGTGLGLGMIFALLYKNPPSK